MFQAILVIAAGLGYVVVSVTAILVLGAIAALLLQE